MGAKCCNQEFPAALRVGELHTAAGISHGQIILENEEHIVVSETGRTGADVDEDVRKAEKERLKLMVRSFASNAVRGAECSILDLKVGTIALGKYSIDRDLTMLTLEQLSGPTIIVEISKICDVFREKELKARRDVTDVEGVVHLNSEQRKRLVVIQSISGAEKRLYGLLEMDRDSRDNFVTCMNILRLYAEVNQ